MAYLRNIYGLRADQDGLFEKGGQLVVHLVCGIAKMQFHRK